ncbi:mitochondrial calcium uniporter regulator 1 [Eucyclogobius newberryi]|uniref:mitochondrial calcium uniporter regulator 1 n=1 Tax=Eucyclogobius newberryi TaxID=166745 RepID=UPI003B5B21C4
MLAKIVKSRLRYLIHTSVDTFYYPVCCHHRFVSKLFSSSSSCAAALTSPSRFKPHFRNFIHSLKTEKPRYEASKLTRHKSVRECFSSTTQTIHHNLTVPKNEGKNLFFDTHAVVRLLEDNGFTTQQAEVIVNVLVQMTHSNMGVIYSDMVTKVQQEIMLQRVMSQIATVKKDMIILEKSEFSTLLAENEKLKIQLLQLKVQLTDIMNKVRSDNLLDLHLEKSRSKELKAQHEKRLLETRTEIMEMTAEHECHLTQTNMKIDTEVAGIKTMLESHKLDTIKYLAGSIFTCLTVVLGFYRIWM